VIGWCLAAGPVLATQTPLRVCADPNNWPMSREDGSGFENEIATLVAADLGRPLAYTWWAQRRGFVRSTLKAGLCDVVIGVPAHHFDMVVRTRPYYRSSYVAVTRADRGLDVERLDDPRLRRLRVGVHLIGDDGANVPPAHVLANLGVVDNVVGFPIYGDYRQDAPPRRLIDAVASGEIDVALAWGPLAGPAAAASSVPLRVTALADADEHPPFAMTFEIAMGVRRDDLALRRALQHVLDERGPDITAILRRHSVPLLPFRQPTVEVFSAQAHEPGETTR
jgi:quinoprotein dehydrogenase-associated probable ABC transporter substrate-binding protein